LGAAGGAVAGGLIGILVTGYLHEAAAPNRNAGCPWITCGYLGGLPLAWLGETVGLGLGAHLGNRRRGNVIAPITASLVVLLVAGIAGDNGRLPERSQWVIPVLQTIAAVASEAAVGRHRARRNPQ
jgi:hypothetical protein